MLQEAHHYLIKLIPKVKQTKQGTTIYQVTAVENIAPGIFPLYPQCLVQFRRQHKKLRINFNI